MVKAGPLKYTLGGVCAVLQDSSSAGDEPIAVDAAPGHSDHEHGPHGTIPPAVPDGRGTGTGG